MGRRDHTKYSSVWCARARQLVSSTSVGATTRSTVRFGALVLDSLCRAHRSPILGFEAIRTLYSSCILVTVRALRGAGARLNTDEPPTWTATCRVVTSKEARVGFGRRLV